MSLDRRTTNPGRREREARKRHRRAAIWSQSQDRWLKLGHKHMQRWIKRNLFLLPRRERRRAVANTENLDQSGR